MFTAIVDALQIIDNLTSAAASIGVAILVAGEEGDFCRGCKKVECVRQIKLSIAQAVIASTFAMVQWKQVLYH